jgi:hypothetical protein
MALDAMFAAMNTMYAQSLGAPRRLALRALGFGRAVIMISPARIDSARARCAELQWALLAPSIGQFSVTFNSGMISGIFAFDFRVTLAIASRPCCLRR